MTLTLLRNTYLSFFKRQGHAVIPSSGLVPQEDPTTLFTGSGMQPMIGYLLGEKHPLGDRIVDSQKCFRAEDIDEVGDNRHTTFFEMLGNWSLGSYWKKEQLSWYWSFLVDELKIDPTKLYVTVFAGDEKSGIAKDEEAAAIWTELFEEKGVEAQTVLIGSEAQGYEVGMQHGRIFYYDSKKNWWSRAGSPDDMPTGEPGGPDSEVFYLFDEISHDPIYGTQCHPNCDCGRFLEIGNSVFMEYVKKEHGAFEPLVQKNIDFGGGLERLLAAIDNQPDVFLTNAFRGILDGVIAVSGLAYDGEMKITLRIVADHIRAASFMIAEGLLPGNKKQDYVLRRLLRRVLLKLYQVVPDVSSIAIIGAAVEGVFALYKDSYLSGASVEDVMRVITEESDKFEKSLRKGMLLLEKHASVSGDLAFDLHQTYGFPVELTQEIVESRGGTFDMSAFTSAREAHRSASKTAGKGMFSGGLADHSEIIVRYHTATHLLHQALRDVLGDHVSQMGSNITSERLRFDFKHDSPLSEEEKQRVCEIINTKIGEDLPVHKTVEAKEKALKSGALAFFRETYPDLVDVYTIGVDPVKDWYSKELCGGPHVSSTGQIGTVTIRKEKSVGAGSRRLYLELV